MCICRVYMVMGNIFISMCVNLIYFYDTMIFYKLNFSSREYSMALLVKRFLATAKHWAWS